MSRAACTAALGALILLAAPAAAQIHGPHEERVDRCRELAQAGEWPEVLPYLADSHPFVRAQAYLRMKDIEDEETIEWLARTGMRARPAIVRRSVAEILGVIGSPVAIPHLERSFRRDDSKAMAARAIGMIGGDEAFDVLAEAMEGRDDTLRVEAAWGLGEIDAARAADLLAEAAGDERARWQVRTVALASLARGDHPRALDLAAGILGGERLNETAPSLIFSALDVAMEVRELAGHDEIVRRTVDALIDILGELSGRTVWDAYRGLKHLTGQTGPGLDADAWANWWATARDSFEARDIPAEGEEEADEPAGRTRARVTFHGEEIWSHRITFIQDMSGSMEMNDLTVSDGEGGEETLTRQALSKRELNRTIRTLGPDHFFNVVFFGTEILSWQDHVTRATPRAREAAISFVRERPNLGRTNWWEALSTAIRDPEVDTIFILSDGGEATEGFYTRYDRITNHVRWLNRTDQVRIHAITIDPGDSYARRRAGRFLRDLCEMSGGRYSEKY